MKLFTLVVLSVGLVSQAEAMYSPYAPPFMGPPRPGIAAKARLFRAKGDQQCWSKEVIGYTCFVDGVGYSDCPQAQFSLRMKTDCCANHYFQGRRVTSGRSIGLINFSCTQW